MKMKSSETLRPKSTQIEYGTQTKHLSPMNYEKKREDRKGDEALTHDYDIQLTLHRTCGLLSLFPSCSEENERQICIFFKIFPFPTVQEEEEEEQSKNRMKDECIISDTFKGSGEMVLNYGVSYTWKETESSLLEWIQNNQFNSTVEVWGVLEGQDSKIGDFVLPFESLVSKSTGVSKEWIKVSAIDENKHAWIQLSLIIKNSTQMNLIHPIDTTQISYLATSHLLQFDIRVSNAQLKNLPESNKLLYLETSLKSWNTQTNMLTQKKIRLGVMKYCSDTQSWLSLQEKVCLDLHPVSLRHLTEKNMKFYIMSTEEGIEIRLGSFYLNLFPSIKSFVGSFAAQKDHDNKDDYDLKVSEQFQDVCIIGKHAMYSDNDVLQVDLIISLEKQLEVKSVTFMNDTDYSSFSLIKLDSQKSLLKEVIVNDGKNSIL